MADLPTRRNIPLNTMLMEVMAAKGNPQLVLQTSMDMISEVVGGTVEFVDATNPIAALWSAAASIHSASVMENTAGLREQYPILAETPAQLYNHMSYKEYLNRFCSPATVPIVFNLSFTDFQTHMVRVPGLDYSMVTIPRDTQITVAGSLKFTLQYPIEIKYFDSESIQITYNNTIESPLQKLSTNLLEYMLINEPASAERWIRFTVPMLQVDFSSSSGNVQQGQYFTRTIPFTDQFYYARCWNRSSLTNGWVEMATTHSPTVYDPTTPTMKLKVVGNELTVSLPTIYQNALGLTGELRIDIYTSKGAAVYRMETYSPNDYVMEMNPIDPNQDSNAYTAAMLHVSAVFISTATMSGGTDEIPFTQMRERVIYNSVGEPDVPITNVQMKTAAENLGFELVTHVDVVTDRIFLATRRLPPPSDPRLMTSANIGIATYVTDDPSQLAHPWIINHGPRTTFLSKNLYRSEEGIIKILTKAEVDAIEVMTATAKTNLLNKNRYLYSPYYYVVDTSGLELELRPYHLDDPKATDLSFITQNPTLQLVVNTSQYNLAKLDNGYQLTIQTKSGSYYKNLEDSEVNAQIGIRLKNSSRFVYWNGVQTGRTQDGERIFTFTLTTNYDLDANEQIELTNGVIDSEIPTPVWVDLKQEIHIFHTTTSIPAGIYKPDATQNMIGLTFLPTPSAAITHETVTATFGHYLKRLWTRARTYPDTEVYKRYTIDVPMEYPEDVYEIDPATGSGISIIDGKIHYNLLYKRGEVVRDEHGQIMYAHRAGETVREGGEPVVDYTRVGTREFDMFFVDGRHYFVTDETFKEYNTEFINVVVNWVLKDMMTLNERTFERTEVLFYPTNQLSIINVQTGEGNKLSLESDQSLTVDVYVSDNVYRDNEQRQILEEKTIRYLDSWISTQQVAISTASTGLMTLYGDVATAVSIKGLGGSQDLQLVNMLKDEDRFCLKRILQAQQDGSFIIREDVTVNFYRGRKPTVDDQL